MRNIHWLRNVFTKGDKSGIELSMSIAFAQATLITRVKGHTAVRAAAYRSGQVMMDNHAGRKITEFKDREGIVHSEIILPHGADPKYSDREFFWNSLEDREDQHSRRATAQLAKDIQIALPRELSQDQHIEMAREFAKNEFVQNGIPVDINIHYDKLDNPHAHILVPFRRLTDQGFGNKARDLNPQFGVNGIVVQGDAAWGEKWRGYQNNYFERNDIPIYIERGSDGISPQIHHGKVAHAMFLEDGSYSEVMKVNEEIKAKTAGRILNNPSFALEKISGKKTLFSKQDISRYIFKFFPDETEFNSVMDRIMVDPNLVYIEGFSGDGRDVPLDCEQVYTTADLLQSEANIGERAKLMAQSSVDDSFKIPFKKIETVVLKHDYFYKEAFNTGLFDDQKEGIRRLLSDSRFVGIIGPAGTGKTAMIEAAREAWDAQGFETRGLALAGKAADGLQGTGLESETIASFERRMHLGDAARYSLKNFVDTDSARDHMLSSLRRAEKKFTSPDDGSHPKWIDRLKESVESGDYSSRGLRWRELQLTRLSEGNEIKPGSVFVLDEAGMVGTRQFERIQERVDLAGAKMVVLFDNCQAPAIEAGAPSRIIEESIACHKLENVVRQKSWWQRRALAEIRDGNFSKGFRKFENKGFVHFENDYQTAKEKLTSNMFEHYRRDPLANRIAGGFTNKVVDELNADIRFKLQERGRLLNGVDLEIVRNDMTAYEEYGGLPIPKNITRNFAPDDRIVFLKNNKDLKIKNGTLGRIEVVSKDFLKVKTADGKLVEFNPKEYKSFDHGYALTVHKLQGETVKGEMHLLASRSWITGRQLTYVAMSRHTDNIHVYGGRDEFGTAAKFVAALSDDRSKSLARDFHKEYEYLPRLDILRSRYSQEFRPIRFVKHDNFALASQTTGREATRDLLSMIVKIERGESMGSLGKPRALFEDVPAGEAQILRSSYHEATAADYSREIEESARDLERSLEWEENMANLRESYSKDSPHHDQEQDHDYSIERD